MKLDTGIDLRLINELKKKAETIAEKEKMFSLLFDMMELKTKVIYNEAADRIDGYQDLAECGGRSQHLADYALVFMLQGLYTTFNEPIAFYFINSDYVRSKVLSSILKVVVSSVNSTGFKVVTTVCDHSCTNIAALNILRQKDDNSVLPNYFILDGEKIFIIFDVPHLYKSICNNFCEAGELVLEGKRAYWSHLVKAQKEKWLREMEITNEDLDPENVMTVQIASDILSNKMVSVLKLMTIAPLALSDRVQENVAILETAAVIEQLHKLFECTSGSNEDNKRNVKVNSYHHERWSIYKKALKSLVFIKSDVKKMLANARCVIGYIVTMTSFADIWQYVAAKGCETLDLRKLNLDALGNFFELIIHHSRKNQNPTCHLFIKALKSIQLTQLLARHRM